MLVLCRVYVVYIRGGYIRESSKEGGQEGQLSGGKGSGR